MRAAGLSSQQHALTASPMRRFGSKRRVQKSTPSKSTKSSTDRAETASATSTRRTLREKNEGAHGTSHVLNYESVGQALTANEERSELKHTRTAGGTHASRTMAEYNLTTSNSYRALHSPKTKPPWTKAELQSFLGHAHPFHRSDSTQPNRALDSPGTHGTNAGATPYNTPVFGSTPAPRGPHHSHQFDFRTQQMPEYAISMPHKQPSPHKSVSPNTASLSSSSQDHRQEPSGAPAASPAQEQLDSIKHTLLSHITDRQDHIARSTAAESAFVESLPASRSVVHHPEYDKQSRAAYRFELDAQVRRRRAKDALEKRRAAKLEARTQKFQLERALEREKSDKRKEERQRRVITDSLNTQIKVHRQKKPALSDRKKRENEDMRELASRLNSVTTHREKLVEAHHESEHHIQLLNWQKLHRDARDGTASRPSGPGARKSPVRRKMGSSPTKRRGGSAGRRRRSPRAATQLQMSPSTSSGRR